MSDTGMVKLIVSVPRELKERLDAVAKSEDRPLASVVRRVLSASIVPNVLPPPKREPLTDVAESIGRKEFHGDIRTGRPVGGQDAAAGKGVEDRQEEATPTIPDLMANLESSLSEAKAARPRPVDHVVIGGPDCTHPQRFVLGRKCEAPGCGKVLK